MELNYTTCLHPLCTEHERRTVGYFADCILEFGELDFALVSGRLLAHCEHGGLRDAALAIAHELEELFCRWDWRPTCSTRSLAQAVAGHILRRLRDA